MTPTKSRAETSMLRQTAVYWGNPQSDGAGGRTFDEAMEIMVRWEQKAMLFVDANGQTATSRAIVYTDRDVEVGGYLQLAELADLDSGDEADPLSNPDAFEIRAFAASPDAAASIFVRKATL